MKATLARLIRALQTLSHEAEDDEIMDNFDRAIQHLEDAIRHPLEEEGPDDEWIAILIPGAPDYEAGNASNT